MQITMQIVKEGVNEYDDKRGRGHIVQSMLTMSDPEPKGMPHTWDLVLSDEDKAKKPKEGWFGRFVTFNMRGYWVQAGDRLKVIGSIVEVK